MAVGIASVLVEPSAGLGHDGRATAATSTLGRRIVVCCSATPPTPVGGGEEGDLGPGLDESSDALRVAQAEIATPIVPSGRVRPPPDCCWVPKIC